MENGSIEVRVAAIEKDMERNSTAHREFYGKFEALGKQQAVIDERYSQIQAILAQIQTDLKELKEKPGRRWESLTNAVLQWVVLAILGAVIIFK